MNNQTATEWFIIMGIKGGYGPNYWRTRLERNPQTDWTGKEWEEVFSMDNIALHLLSPAFWREVGKELGWKQKRVTTPAISGHTGNNQYHGAEFYGFEWLYHWHRLIDHLAQDGSIESFCEEIKNDYTH